MLSSSYLSRNSVIAIVRMLICRKQNTAIDSTCKILFYVVVL